MSSLNGRCLMAPRVDSLALAAQWTSSACDSGTCLGSVISQVSITCLSSSYVPMLYEQDAEYSYRQAQPSERAHRG